MAVTDQRVAELERSNEIMRNVVGQLRAALAVKEQEVARLRADVHPCGQVIHDKDEH